jgi:hypothetical protein
LIVQFCANSPLIGDTCVEPAGLDVSSATITGSDTNINAAGWSKQTTGNYATTPTRFSAFKNSGTTAAAGVNHTFVVTGVTNPSLLNCAAPVAGTGTIDSSGTAVTGTGTNFDPEVTVGDYIQVGSQTRRVTVRAAAADTALTVDRAFNANLTGATFTVLHHQPTDLNACTFYARITTYADTAFGGGTPYASAVSPGAFVDFGGIALSTTQTITITARVQEQLTFCVSGSDPAAWTTTFGCDDPAVTPPAITLGNTSSPPILDNLDYYRNQVFSQTSTNATSGVVVALRTNAVGNFAINPVTGDPAGGSTCDGLSADNHTSTLRCIPAVHPDLFRHAAGQCTDNSTACQIFPGEAAFGMFVRPTNDASLAASQPTDKVGDLTSDTNYYNVTHADYQPTSAASDVWYGMDTETTTDPGSTTSTYGDRVCYSTAPIYHVASRYDFAATASLTTPAGIYTINMSLIATGTF